NDDAALGLAFFLDTLDHDAVVKRTELHGFSSNFFGFWCERVARVMQQLVERWCTLIHSQAISARNDPSPRFFRSSRAEPTLVPASTIAAHFTGSTLATCRLSPRERLCSAGTTRAG